MFVNQGLGATLNVAKPKKGQSVAIFGLGAVGLAVSSYHFVHFLIEFFVTFEVVDIFSVF